MQYYLVSLLLISLVVLDEATLSNILALLLTLDSLWRTVPWRIISWRTVSWSFRVDDCFLAVRDVTFFGFGVTLGFSCELFWGFLGTLWLVSSSFIWFESLKSLKKRFFLSGVAGDLLPLGLILFLGLLLFELLFLR